ncbi:MAG TPA: hypothetical protein VFV33_19530 [Gemmatimonadaceae bacterium]|nr:hypothetical protein [Gemmatimonadaceae bacterium]
MRLAPRPCWRSAACAAAAVGALAVEAKGVAAQHPHAPPRPDSVTPRSPFRVGAMGIALGSMAAPGVRGERVTEGYLTQPMLFGGVQLAGGAVQALATVNLEGATLRRGEINPGSYGEGYSDRRHPHTYAHELMLGVQGGTGATAVSLWGGKGVVPFGSDDPMVRPFVKYPVNHHLAQVMERVLVVGSVRLHRTAVEFARFNGDEPEGPADWPNAGRAMDSWSTRLTTWGWGGFELSASAARVQSPEFATGQGLDQRKEAASLRWAAQPGSAGARRYALVEWARTREGNRRQDDIFTFQTVLAEGGAVVRGATIAVRLERTERPEEDRLSDPYRTVRPLLDFNILGRTRWGIVTANVAAPASTWGRLQWSPFVEAAWLRPRALSRPTPLDPVAFFDASQLWLWSAGIRLHAGTMRPRFGRYGVAIPAAPAH